MLKLIIEKELLENIKTTKFAITFCICSVLILLSFYVAAKNYKVAQARYETAKTENLRKLEGITDWLQVRQFRVYLPPQPIDALVNGVTNDIGRTTEIKEKGELKAEDSIYGDDPIFAVFRFMDLQFLFTVILSLFAILFAYDSINGEKERGTLRLIFSYSVPRDIYISGKLIGSLLSLVMPLMIPILIGLALLPVLGAPLSGEAWGKLFFVLLAGMLLTGTFLTLSVMVSAMTQKSSTSFLMLLVVWIFAVMIVPRLSVITAGAVIKVPPVDEINSLKVRLQSQLWGEQKNALNNFKPPVGASMEEVMASLNKFMQQQADEREKKIQDLSKSLNEDRNNKGNSMQKLAFTLAHISPSAVFTFAAQNAAGTSMNLEEEYQRALLAYRDSYVKFLNAKTGGMGGGGFMIYKKISGDKEKPTPINTREIPEFIYASQPLSASIASAAPELGALVLFNIIFFTGAFFSFRKYDVR